MPLPVGKFPIGGGSVRLSIYFDPINPISIHIYVYLGKPGQVELGSIQSILIFLKYNFIFQAFCFIRQTRSVETVN